jgi:hypothetical protein
LRNASESTAPLRAANPTRRVLSMDVNETRQNFYDKNIPVPGLIIFGLDLGTTQTRERMQSRQIGFSDGIIHANQMPVCVGSPGGEL